MKLEVKKTVKFLWSPDNEKQAVADRGGVENNERW